MKQQSAMPNFGAGGRSRRPRKAPPEEVVSITNAAEAHSEEMRHRMVKYAITMGIRMVCLAAIFLFDGWYKLIPVVGAVVLPWVAVVIANGGSDITHRETVDLLDEAPRYAVTDGLEGAADGSPAEGEVLTGEIVPDTADETETGQQEEPRHEHP